MLGCIYLVQFTLVLVGLSSIYADGEQCIINSENNLTRIGQSWSELLANWAICCKQKEHTTAAASDVNSNLDDFHSSEINWTTEPPKEAHPEGPEHYASSAPYLISLVRAEMDIYKELVDYANALEKRLELIKMYMKDYEDSTIRGTQQLEPDLDPWLKASHAASHPLIAYRSVRRFSQEFRDFSEHIWQNYEQRLEEVVANLEGEHGWPSQEDSEDRMEAILRLHYTYGLDLDEFTNGIIGGVDTDVHLPTHQIFEIAEFAIKEKYYSLVPDWLQLTESRIATEDVPGITMEDVENAYQRNMELHDQNFKNLFEQGHKYLYDKPLIDSDSGVRTMREFGMSLIPFYMANLDFSEYPEGTGEFFHRYDLNHYISMELCSGGNYQTEEYKSQLTCWYDTSRSHYFGHINPLKVELLNQDPLLIQFYDVIGNTWIDSLVQKSYTKLRKEAPLGTVYSTPRIASYAYLTDEELVDTPVSRRIELITRLNVLGRSASDTLQITSYASGGHVGLHYDSFGLNSSMPRFYELGDRVTTFLIYLNDVEEGGYTSFPVLRTHAKPIKGSALLYYLSLKNGDQDMRMMHEACPVLLGHKWIASKSTYLNANFLKRPCDLDPSV